MSGGENKKHQKKNKFSKEPYKQGILVWQTQAWSLSGSFLVLPNVMGSVRGMAWIQARSAWSRHTLLCGADGSTTKMA